MSLRIVGGIVRWFGHAKGATDIILFLVPTSLVTLFSTGWAAMSSEPLHWIVLMAVATFCFTAVALSTTIKFIRENSLRYKVSFGPIEKVHIEARPDNSAVIIQLGMRVHNSAKVPIFFNIDILNFLLQDKGNQGASLVGEQQLIMPESWTTYLLPSISDIVPGPVNGALRFQVKYGRKSDKINLSISAKYVIAGLISVDGEKPEFMVNIFVEEMEY